MTILELTDKEAELFKTFRKYQDVWEKVLSVRDGSIELHIDSQGKIRKIGYNSWEKVAVDN